MRLPEPVDSYEGVINATQFAAQCVQLAASIRIDMPPEMLKDVMAAVPDFDLPIPQSEDCEFLLAPPIYACPAQGRLSRFDA